MNSEQRASIKKAVILCLEAAPVLDIPVNVKEIAKSYPLVECRVIPYSRYMTDRGMNYLEMIQFAGSKSAFADSYSEHHCAIIGYNDIDFSETASNRYRWNIAHELGHIALGHHDKYQSSRLFRGEMTTQEYAEAEEEADQFAAYLLAPHGALFHLSIKNKYDIGQYCRISRPAAGWRYSDFCLWKLFDNPFKDGFDNEIVRLFSTVLDVKYGVLHYMCSTCGLDAKEVNVVNGEFCYICGNNTKKHARSVDIVKYAQVETDKSGRVLECPYCENEIFVEGADYCHICGKPVKNICWNCGDNNERKSCTMAEQHGVPSNARYCPYCGETTTFNVKDVLMDWVEERRKFEESEIETLPF